MNQKIWAGIAWLLLMAVSANAADQRTILVMGATGRQGGAAVDELIKRGFAVRGMTRKPDGKKAIALRDKGVTIVQGDFSDPGSLNRAFAGVDGAFFYSGFSRNEYEEGQNVIAAAKAAAVPHVVYSSGAAAEPERGMSDAVKMQVEQDLVASGVPYTVLRPVAFMENFRGQQKQIIKNGVVDSRAPNRLVYFIAVSDIGFFVGEAIDHPDEWVGRGENISTDQMTLKELAATFERVLEQPVAYVRQPLDLYLERFPAVMRPLFRWYDEVGYSADTASLRKRYPDLLTLEQYLRANGWENVASDK